MKTIEDEGQKQVEALKIKGINDKSDNNPTISKEIYDKILEERMNEILKMSREIDYYNLVYKFKGPTKAISFTKSGGPMYTYDQLKKGKKKTLQQIEKEQDDFKKDLNEVTGNSKYKNKSQLYKLKNTKNLYDSRQIIIDLLNDNSKIRSEANYKANKKTAGTGLKTLTPKHALKIIKFLHK